MSLSRSYKNHDIEVLRAIAILFVVVHHIGYLFPWDGAWQKLFAIATYWGGVDLFFCVSGFVIASSLLKEAKGASFFDFAIPFWIKRVWRLWPAAMFWLFVAIVASKMFNTSGAFGLFKANVEDGIAAVMQVANFHFLNCWYYKQGLCGNEAIYWSLSLEEQFYFVFPFVLFFLPRKWLRPGLIAVILLQFFVYRPIGAPLWLTRTDAICYGVLIAVASRGSVKDKLYPHFLESRVMAIAFSLALIFLLGVIPTNNVVWFDTGLLAVVCAILVFIASYDRRLILPVPFLEGIFGWIGSRSYAIYLTHLFAFWLTHEIFYRRYPGVRFNDSFMLEFALVALCLIVVFSEASYRLIETPLRNKGREMAERYRMRRTPGGDEAVTTETPPIEPVPLPAEMSGVQGDGLLPLSAPATEVTAALRV